jgi:hypothetical protein
MTSSQIGADRLREILDYDKGTGLFTWRVKTSNRAVVGKVAGAVTKHGYIQIQIDGKIYLAHRLAWLHVHGEWPSHQVDHIDQVRGNNAISNLRPATATQNAYNSAARPSRSGIKGVSWSKVSGKWVAHVIADKVHYHLGLFDCMNEAASVVAEARKRLHGEFANHG